jgi:hypothetical protein
VSRIASVQMSVGWNPLCDRRAMLRAGQAPRFSASSSSCFRSIPQR